MGERFYRGDKPSLNRKRFKYAWNTFLSLYFNESSFHLIPAFFPSVLLNVQVRKGAPASSHAYTLSIFDDTRGRFGAVDKICTHVRSVPK